MAKTIQTSVEIRSAAITLRKEDYSLRNVACKLKIYKGVQSTVKRFESSRRQSGRPRITSKAEDIRIQIICKLNRRLTASQILADLNHSRLIPVSLTIVKRATKSWWFKRLHSCQKIIAFVKKSQNAVGLGKKSQKLDI